MLKRLSVLLCLLLTLPSCGSVVSDTEALLRPPTLNKQQGEVYAALEQALNIADITYKYPQRGERLSPFVFYDMDGDGLQEAIVFYSYTSDRSNTRAMVMLQDGGNGWTPFHDFSMPFDQVDFVQFSHLLSQSSACLVIGWQNTSAQSGRGVDSALSIHSMADGAITPEVPRRSYVDYIIEDFDGDGLDELVTVERDSGQTLCVSLLRARGHRIDLADSVALCPKADLLLGMTHGRLSGGGSAVYIDEERVDFDIATEVVRVGVNGLTMLVGGNEESTQDNPVQAWDNYLNTLRATTALSRDYNSDGIVDIPYPEALPGSLFEGDDNPLMLTRMYNVTSNTLSALTVPFSAIVNEAEGYMVYYPEKWEDRVSVRRDDASAMWQFYTVSAGGEAQTELLRIQASDVLPDAGADSNANLIALGNRGGRYFYGYIPLTTGDVPSITEPELMEMFKLIG